MLKKVKSDYLFAQPSFGAGAARLLDLWCQFDDYNRSESTVQADGKAIAADWFVVGQDIFYAIDSESKEA